MRFFALIFPIVMTSAVLGSGEESIRTNCTSTAELVLNNPKNGSYTVGDVRKVFETMLRETGCDDGVFGEGATEIVCQALMSDFEGMVRFGKSDIKVLNFILKHIDATAADRDLKTIASKEAKCTDESKEVCQQIIKKAKESLLDEKQSTSAAAKSSSTQKSSCIGSQLVKVIKNNPALAKDLIGFDQQNKRIVGCGWNDAMREVESGNFELADLLRPHTDGSFSEDLTHSIELSLYHTPAKALKRGVCLPGVIEPSLPDWIELLRAGLKKMKMVTDVEAEKLKNKCILEFREHLRRAEKEYRDVCVSKTQTASSMQDCSKSNRFDFELGRR